jgi:LCP family protein required for cell wall assembly
MKRIHRHILSILVLTIAVTSCAGGIASLPVIGAPLATINPNAPATNTPFQPEPVTPAPRIIPTTPTPTSVNPWGYFAAPVEPSAIEIRRPMDPLKMSDEVVNIILLGSDRRPDSFGHRTDTMMIVSLDIENGQVTLFSIPRDLYVFQPGWRVDRINTADVLGGFQRVSDTILYNFGIKVDHWARIQFTEFIRAINLLGGIDVQVGAPLGDYCNKVFWSYSPGVHHMDGQEALCYVRMRKNSGGDFDRLRRQQEVIVAVFNKFLTLDGLSRVPELFTQFAGLIETDMTVEDILPLIPFAAKIASDPSRIRRVTIDLSMSSLWRVPYSGASVVLPDWEKIEAMLHETFESG